MGNNLDLERKGTVVILLNRKKEPFWVGTVAYLKRPVIYFCFGLPLLAPSVMLIILGSLEDDVSRTFLALGWTMFVLALLCFAVGAYLGLSGLHRTRKYKAQKDLLDESKGSIPSDSETASCNTPSTMMSTLSLSTPSDPASSQSSRRSSMSRSSVNTSTTSLKSNTSSSSSNMSVLSTNDKSKLVGLKKKAMRQKRGVKFPTDRLPSLQEEDTLVKSISRGNSQAEFALHNNAPSSSTGKRAPANGKPNMEELKGYLNTIGLGGPRPGHPTAQATTGIHRISKSFGENDLPRPNHGLELHHPYTSREDLKKKSSTSQPDQPILVVTSHERTGVYLPKM
ncbi:trinucleotide repeat-containing gene 18 protein-like [Aplysia californica]|uniref:Trinucleotide repeat-containing gene 18 protein-like n=1 Tax=Aplysia californica TaxID=6500 RepID=A0ABM1AEZ1_APLCA|nr:trinucleotide repeat-containing gene 18 protein-like [Aplysia californica]